MFIATLGACAALGAGIGAAPAAAAGGAPSDRAVVVIEGGGTTHAFTTPSAACDGGRAAYVQALRDAGLPVFTAPGFTNTLGSTSGETGCPPQPPLEVQWNTAAYPTQAGRAVLGLLGYLNATYGYRTFDLVGYSYGGLVARATVAALKHQPAAAAMAPAFSYAQSAVAAGVTVSSIVTLNSPHFGSPTYDIASDPARYLQPVARAWGKEFADAGEGLAAYQRTGGAGAIQVLATRGHARRSSTSWDARQVGALKGVALTLIAGDRCGRTCAAPNPQRRATTLRLRTDGTVPVYSQLMLPCPGRCPGPPGSVYVPPGLLPEETVRKTFPTIHSTYETARLGLPKALSVSRNPAAIAYLVRTVVNRWTAAGLPVTP